MQILFSYHALKLVYAHLPTHSPKEIWLAYKIRVSDTQETK